MMLKWMECFPDFDYSKRLNSFAGRDFQLNGRDLTFLCRICAVGNITELRFYDQNWGHEDFHGLQHLFHCPMIRALVIIVYHNHINIPTTPSMKLGIRHISNRKDVKQKFFKNE